MTVEWHEDRECVVFAEGEVSMPLPAFCPARDGRSLERWREVNRRFVAMVIHQIGLLQQHGIGFGLICDEIARMAEVHRQGFDRPRKWESDLDMLRASG